MYLLLDIGNTREKAALFNADSITALPQLTADSLKQLPLIAVYFACVANDSRLSAVKVRLELDHIPWRQVCSEAQAFGVTNCYAEPHLLGVDRWLALLGAQKLFAGKAVMIVDAGTALTIDWLDEQGNIPPLYVIKRNPAKNQLVVGLKPSTETNTFEVTNLHQINPKIDLESLPLKVRIRHTGQLVDCQVQAKNNTLLVKTSEPLQGVAEGQFAVFYTEEFISSLQKAKYLCLGGGTIT